MYRVEASGKVLVSPQGCDMATIFLYWWRLLGRVSYFSMLKDLYNLKPFIFISNRENFGIFREVLVRFSLFSNVCWLWIKYNYACEIKNNIRFRTRSCILKVCFFSWVSLPVKFFFSGNFHYNVDNSKTLFIFLLSNLQNSILFKPEKTYLLKRKLLIK